jgi:hypothetical protein
VLIRSIGNNFFTSTSATDENSQAYHKILKGENPQSSTNSQSHIGSRLLTLRFLDIVQSLDKETDIDDDEQLVWKNTLIPKTIVCFNVLFILELRQMLLTRTFLIGQEMFLMPVLFFRQRGLRIRRIQIQKRYCLSTLPKIRG